jgi:hypothetical protein
VLIVDATSKIHGAATARVGLPTGEAIAGAGLLAAAVPVGGGAGALTGARTARSKVGAPPGAATAGSGAAVWRCDNGERGRRPEMRRATAQSWDLHRCALGRGRREMGKGGERKIFAIYTSGKRG